MAKELPYFKFEPGQWENGTIQMFTHEQKGLFIDLCCMYWQRLGDIPYKLAVQKICNGNATALDGMIEEGIIKVIDQSICIDFLNEQLDEFEQTSKTNSENARLGWEKRRKKANSMRPHSDRNAIREDKIKEEEIKEDKTKTLMSEANASNVTEKNIEYLKLSKAFYELFKKNSNSLNVDWIHLKKISAKKFIDPIRLMIEIDNRSEDDIITVGKFLQEDEFWMQNIQSTSKLREKFDQLITKAKNGKQSNKAFGDWARNQEYYKSL